MKFDVIPYHRIDDAIIHLRENFFCDEPLNKSVNLCEPGEGHDALEVQSMTAMKEGVSVMAISDTDQIAGICINGITHCGDIEKCLKKLQCSNDRNYRNIFQFLYEENLKLHLFDRLSTDEIFELKILSVDSSFRGQSIAKNLIEQSLRIAMEKGIKFVKTDATSFYSQKIMSSFGFKTIAEIPFENHFDENGEQIFKVEPPHIDLKIMVKNLDDVRSVKKF